MSTVIRPSWSPKTASKEQLDLLAETQAAWKAAKAAEDEAWRLTSALRASGVPDTSMCDLVDELTRPTLNRKLGPRSGKP